MLEFHSFVATTTTSFMTRLIPPAASKASNKIMYIPIRTRRLLSSSPFQISVPDEATGSLLAIVRINLPCTSKHRTRIVDIVDGNKYVIARMSSKPSLSGENGLGDNERPAADGIPFVNMLLVCKGVAPDGATDVLQLRLSLLSTDGLIRSMDLPVAGVLRDGLCHDEE